MYGGKLQKIKFKYTGTDVDAILDRIPTAEVISKEDMENLLFFTDNDEQILENYELVDGNPTSYQEKVIKKLL